MRGVPSDEDVGVADGGQIPRRAGDGPPGGQLGTPPAPVNGRGLHERPPVGELNRPGAHGRALRGSGAVTLMRPWPGSRSFSPPVVMQ
ncbi:hypothetical protein GCM10010400_66860 [Streptomyces aculeolatus]